MECWGQNSWMSFKGHETIGLGKEQRDITNEDDIRKVLTSFKPEVVINSAAFTKVDECESKADLAYLVNAEGPKILAMACKRIGIKLVHIKHRLCI